MTKEQANQWLKEVAGRKIRRSHWPKDWYVVPTEKWFDKTYTNPHYWRFECIESWHFMREGFSKDNYGHSWEYFEDFETYLELLDL